MLVEVWSDVVCPWCYIGKRRFEAAQRRLADDTSFGDEIEVVYRPFQLDPKAPPGTSDAGGRGVRPQVRRRRAGHGDHRPRHRGRRRRGPRVPPRPGAPGQHPRRPPPALATPWSTDRRAPRPRSKERLLPPTSSTASDIGDPDVLADGGRRRRARRRRRRASFLDGDAGLAELQAELAAAAEAGITAVPTYVIDRRWAIPGAQDPDVFVQVLRRLAAERAG